jgi:type I restriction enzyme, S subunit
MGDARSQSRTILHEDGGVMEVKSGYKKSEVGVVPDDWDVKRLGALGSVVRGGSPRPAGDPRYFDGDFIPWLTVAALTNISDYALDITETVGFLTEEGSKHSRTLPADTLIIANSGATLGVAKILGTRCCANDGIAAIINQHSGNKLFICHYLNTQTKTLREVVATGNGQPNLNTNLIRDIAIPFPPLCEQRAIAAALSDFDALLSGLDRLIAKKRDLKQAAMQQLLTGQTRLPGFHGEWEVKRLGDYVTFLRNGVNSRAELLPQGRVRYLHYGDVHACKDIYISPKTLPSLPDVKAVLLDRLRDGDLVFADASEDIAGVSKSVEVRGVDSTELVAGLHTIAARFNKAVLADGFKGFLQFCPSFAAHLRRLAAGTKVYATNRAHIASVEMRLPSVREQVAIAIVLSDIEAELSALEARRDKTRALKQAMMQELLTGKTRLIARGDAESAEGR